MAGETILGGRRGPMQAERYHTLYTNEDIDQQNNPGDKTKDVSCCEESEAAEVLTILIVSVGGQC